MIPAPTVEKPGEPVNYQRETPYQAQHQPGEHYMKKRRELSGSTRSRSHTPPGSDVATARGIRETNTCADTEVGAAPIALAEHGGTPADQPRQDIVHSRAKPEHGSRIGEPKAGPDPIPAHCRNPVNHLPTR